MKVKPRLWFQLKFNHSFWFQIHPCLWRRPHCNRLQAGRRHLLPAAPLPLRGWHDLAGRHHAPRHHHGHEEEVLSVAVLERLRQVQCHCKVEFFTESRKAVLMLSFLCAGITIHWWNLPLPPEYSWDAPWETAQSQAHVRQWSQAADLGTVCQEVQHSEHCWVLRLYRGKFPNQ